MGGVIHAYYDFGTSPTLVSGTIANSAVSPYSFFAFVHLRRVRSALASHGVTVEYAP